MYPLLASFHSCEGDPFIFGNNTEKYPLQRMTDIEDAEDAEIQRQLLEAKQRIAPHLRRQVEREQKLQSRN